MWSSLLLCCSAVGNYVASTSQQRGFHAARAVCGVVVQESEDGF
jgi:hypothetical protein